VGKLALGVTVHWSTRRAVWQNSREKKKQLKGKKNVVLRDGKP